MVSSRILEWQKRNEAIWNRSLVVKKLNGNKLLLLDKHFYRRFAFCELFHEQNITYDAGITLLTRALHTKRKVARLEYASRAIFTGFSFLWRQPAKIHISNVRRRIRETMSTKPRDSSKMISGGPRNGPPPPSYHAARKNIERARARARSFCNLEICGFP